MGYEPTEEWKERVSKIPKNDWERVKKELSEINHMGQLIIFVLLVLLFIEWFGS